jgi:hypothetical protein
MSDLFLGFITGVVSCVLILMLFLFVRILKRWQTFKHRRPAILRDADLAYRHGIQVGQQMMKYCLMPTQEERVQAMQECASLVREADLAGIGLDCYPLNEFRIVT